jgi:hypothetical protein
MVMGFISQCDATTFATKAGGLPVGQITQSGLAARVHEAIPKFVI